MRIAATQVVVFLMVLSVAATSRAQPSDSKLERKLIPVRYGSAAELSTVFTNLFAGELSVESTPQQFGNALLVRGPTDTISQLTEMLTALDQPQPEFVIHIDLLEYRFNDDPSVALTLAGFSGPTGDVQQRMAVGQGDLVGRKRVDLRASANSSGSVQVTANTPVLVGFHRNPRTLVPTYQSQPLGLTATATPKSAENGAVEVLLRLEETRLGPEADAVEADLGEESSRKIPSLQASKFDGKVSIPPGHTVAVALFTTSGKAEPTQRIVLVSVTDGEESGP